MGIDYTGSCNNGIGKPERPTPATVAEDNHPQITGSAKQSLSGQSATVAIVQHVARKARGNGSGLRFVFA